MKLTPSLVLILLFAAGASADTPDAVPSAETPSQVARAIVVHLPPIRAVAGTPVELEAMIDAPYAESLGVRWRPGGEAGWQDASFERSSAGGWFASLPADERGIEYYIRGRDAAGVDVDHFASEGAPHVVRVDPAVADRLEELDLQRLRGRRNAVSLDVVAHNFGNRYDIPDRFIRTELVYSYKLLRELHEIAFGFGSLTGRTPEMSVPGGDDVLKGARYGFGQVRVRAHPSFFIDGRLGLGVSHDEFAANARGALTFGKPWRSCVQVGAEYMGDLGPTGWVRLQWDTAPPLLMGASIVRTDLPGVEISRAGLYIAYDVAYQVADRFTMRAQLSYGPRDGAGNVGGGLGTAFAF
jgi:hypothetical protein